MTRTYSQLSGDERRKLEQWRVAKISIDVIAEKLGRHRSTIFRELKRNRFQDIIMPHITGYFFMVAKMKSATRPTKDCKLIRHTGLQNLIIDRIKAGWTPEQIAGRMRLENAPVRVCQETIYRFVYSEEGRKHDLWWYLPEHRRKRRRRGARKRPAPKFKKENSILFRPDIVAHRGQFGHWEGDLMLFKQKFGQMNVTSMVERLSRFTLILKNRDRRTRPIMDTLIRVFGALPIIARRSVTFDRGSEFIDWPHLQAHVGMQTWFCDPQSPWQKGTVENTNRRARRWLPRELDPATITDSHLKAICEGLNSTPRKCLGWKTPAELFREKVLDKST